MTKEIYVNVGERETRIAVTEDNKLVELLIERAERVVGSLYKCRVMNVLQSLDAAFVDIGLERNAFLYVGDVLPTGEDGVSREAAPPPPPEPPRANNSRRARFARDRRPAASISETGTPSAPGEAGAGGAAPGEPFGDEAPAPAAPDDAVAESAALADAEFDADTDDEDEDDEAQEGGQPGGGPAARRPRGNFRRANLRHQRIKDVLKPGQELLVQVIKGPRSTKGARVSTRISLPGRYLVIMPEADHLGVSRKVEDVRERDRLKKIGERLRPDGFGLIIRTEAEEKTEAELKGDLDYLVAAWREMQAKAREMRAPALIQHDLTLLYKTIRDVFGSDVQKLVIDDPAEYEKANELLERLSPKLKGRIHLYDGVQPIFDKYGLENEIDKLTRRKVFLKSGGSLIIDETEALTVIDVNTSKAVGGGSLAETIARTNVEAAMEIARQLRLRDIGGIIVVDFIDMNNPKDKQATIKALETALKKDRARNKISNISPLGLVEMTRKRTGETLNAFLSDECPVCKGRGVLPSAETVSILLERDLRRQGADPKHAKRDAFLVTCHPEVAELLIGPEGSNITEIERELQKAVFVRADGEAHVEDYAVTPGDIGDLEKSKMGYRRAQVVECRVVRSLLKENGKCVGWADGYMVDLDDGARVVGQVAKVRIEDARRSYAVGKLVPGTARPVE